MTNEDRLLVLDAALVACEGIEAPPEVIDAMSTLWKYLDAYGFGELNESFDKFLTAQHQAVKKLASNPQVFGYDPTANRQKC